jgi:hypothetical protein
MLWDTCMVSRVFAHQRRLLERMSLPRRLLYAGGMPLLPALQFWRSCRTMKADPDLLRRYLLHSPLILALVSCSAVSEAIGYLNASPRFREHLAMETSMRRACD